MTFGKRWNSIGSFQLDTLLDFMKGPNWVKMASVAWCRTGVFVADIDFIFFDLGNVIVGFDHDLMCRQVASVSGIGVEVVERLLLGDNLQNQYEFGLLTSQQFFDAFCQQTNSTPGKQAFFNALSDIFVLNSELMPLLANLQAINFPRGVLSNTCEAHWEFVIRQFPSIRSVCSNRILSYEIKCMKPHEQIYDVARKAAGIPAENIFFVDDRRENVNAARQAGLVASQFEDAAGLVETLQALGVRISC